MENIEKVFDKNKKVYLIKAFYIQIFIFIAFACLYGYVVFFTNISLSKLNQAILQTAIFLTVVIGIPLLMKLVASKYTVNEEEIYIDKNVNVDIIEDKNTNERKLLCQDVNGNSKEIELLNNTKINYINSDELKIVLKEHDCFNMFNEYIRTVVVTVDVYCKK